MNKKFISIITVLLLTLTVVSTVSANQGYVSGGGQILEAPEGTKRPDWLVISFGGWAEDLGTSFQGEWEVNFHNVGGEVLDGSKFHSTDIRAINFFGPSSDTCYSAFNMTMYGSWNGNPGYQLIFRAGDYGPPGQYNDYSFDTIRFELRDASGVLVYDTHASNEFTDESSCVGTARTGLDAGNLTIVLP